MNDKKIVLRFFLFLVMAATALAANLIAAAMRPGVSVIPGGGIDTVASIRVFRAVVMIISLIPFLVVTGEVLRTSAREKETTIFAGYLFFASIMVLALGVALGATAWPWFQATACLVYTAMWMGTFSFTLMEYFPAVIESSRSTRPSAI